MKINPHDSAMPVTGSYEIYHGLTKREKLIFDLYSKNSAELNYDNGQLMMLARYCINAADILLAEMNKE